MAFRSVMLGLNGRLTTAAAGKTSAAIAHLAVS
jgi:hypothetical protein